MTQRLFLYFIGIIFISMSISAMGVFLIAKILPVNLSEIFLIPGIVLVLSANKDIKDIIIRNLKKKNIVICFFALSLFSIIGLMTGNNIAFVYSDFRSIFIFLFFSILVVENYEKQVTFKNFVYHIFICVSLFDFIFLLFRKSYFYMDTERFIALTICPFVLSIIFLNKNKYFSSGVFLIILIYQTVVSTMRINYVFIIFYLLYLLFFIFISIRNKKMFFKSIVFVVLLVFSSFKFAPLVLNFLESNGSRYVHSIVRTESMLNNFDEEEEIRINTIKLFYKEPMSLIFPQGLGWRNHIDRIQNLYREKYSVLSTMDSNIFYCFYHFGLFFGFLIIIFLFRLLFHLFINVLSQCSFIGFVYYTVLIGSFCSMFVLKSWIFVYFNFGFIYAFIIVLLRYPDKYFLKH